MSLIEQFFGGRLFSAFGVLFSSYFIGCFTTGYYLVRWQRGQDVRELGSGNVGARNVGRILGSAGFLGTLLGDFAKGVLAVALTAHFTNNEHLMLLSVLAVVVGHIWPAQLGFRGGKGVATSIGALLILNFFLAWVFIACLAVGFAFARRSVLSGLTAYMLLPLVSFFLKQEGAQTGGLSVLAALVLAAHHKNISEEINQLLARRNHPPEN